MSSTATIAHQSTAQRRTLLRAANAILALAALALLALSAYFVHAHKARYVIVGSAVVALCCLALLASKPALRIFAASLMIGSIAGLYATEAISRMVYNDDLPYESGVRKAAAAAGVASIRARDWKPFSNTVAKAQTPIRLFIPICWSAIL